MIIKTLPNFKSYPVCKKLVKVSWTNCSSAAAIPTLCVVYTPQAAPCWPLMVCQASFSCRNSKNWSWPTVPEPLLSSLNTTHSTCPTAWSLSKTTNPADQPMERSLFSRRHPPPPPSSSTFSLDASRKPTCSHYTTFVITLHLGIILFHLPLSILNLGRTVRIAGRWWLLRNGAGEKHWVWKGYLFQSQQKKIAFCLQKRFFFLNTKETDGY